ncbi:MAG: hypothetical protein A2170_14360 [Deltaproteobacteria bacterium RBG_13_53_10]|nr:MAG: hypothetical protein A2170_14360 [Deltaproteobacteria bacterium RBG_13_53_10]
MKFLVDRMLGKLAKNLRTLGYDTLYYHGEDPRQLIEMARQQGRAVLTRNTNVIPERPQDEILMLEQDDPDLQVKHLIKRGVLSLDEARPFSRCLLCNVLLVEIPAADVEGKVPDFIFYHQKEFFQCPDCDRIYWRGSHQENMQKWLEGLFAPH